MRDNNPNSQSLENLRHTCSHLLAAAVLELWPKTLITLGPPINNGFYYDFDFQGIKISNDDLLKIEKKMQTIVKNWTQINKISLTKSEAIKRWKNNPYKLDHCLSIG